MLDIYLSERAEIVSYFNKHFRFVFSPNPDLFLVIPAWYKDNIHSDRFLIGAGSIAKYVTEKNAITVLKTSLNMKTDKTTLKFRKWGKIEIYVK